MTDKGLGEDGAVVSGTRTRKGQDRRQVINAILFKLRTGAPWRDLPGRYGPWKTAHERLRKWTLGGTWEKILAEAAVKDDALGKVGSILSVDSTVVRPPPACCRCPEERDCLPAVKAIAVDGEGNGRSRGGPGSKIHLAVDGRACR